MIYLQNLRDFSSDIYVVTNYEQGSLNIILRHMSKLSFKMSDPEITFVIWKLIETGSKSR